MLPAAISLTILISSYRARQSRFFLRFNLFKILYHRNIEIDVIFTEFSHVSLAHSRFPAEPYPITFTLTSKSQQKLRKSDIEKTQGGS